MVSAPRPLPIKRDQATFGALVLFAAEPGYFLEDEIRLMSSVADNLSFGLAAQEEEQRRQQAESARRASEQQFASAFEHAAIGVALVSTAGRFLRVNRALTEMLGYSEAELLARTFHDITHPADLAVALRDGQRLLSGAIDSFQTEKRISISAGRWCGLF